MEFFVLGRPWINAFTAIEQSHIKFGLVLLSFLGLYVRRDPLYVPRSLRSSIVMLGPATYPSTTQPVSGFCPLQKCMSP